MTTTTEIEVLFSVTETTRAVRCGRDFYFVRDMFFHGGNWEYEFVKDKEIQTRYTVGLYRTDKGVMVPSKCSCRDHKYRRRACKHMLVVEQLLKLW